MNFLAYRIGRLERSHSRDLGRFITVMGAGTYADACATLQERGIAFSQKDIVFEAPGPTPPEVEIVQVVMSPEDWIDILARDDAVTGLNSIIGNQHVGTA